MIEFTDSPPDPVTEPSAVQISKPKPICKKRLANVLHKSGQKSVTECCSLEPFPQPKDLTKSGQKHFSDHSSSEPFPWQKMCPNAVKTSSSRPVPPPKPIPNSGKKPVSERCSSESVPGQKTLPKSGQKPVPSRSLSELVPPSNIGTQLTAYHAKSISIVAKTREKAVHLMRVCTFPFDIILLIES